MTPAVARGAAQVAAWCPKRARLALVPRKPASRCRPSDPGPLGLRGAEPFCTTARKAGHSPRPPSRLAFGTPVPGRRRGGAKGFTVHPNPILGCGCRC
jgi:hypothetical protein